tara:strand:+ start:15174 stop:16352 length:1179 start_codon:yes stop_codon:yes gene_type:complete
MGSVFSHHSTNADRSAGDRRRHKQKIEKAIREGIHDIVAEESIIGQNGKKKIKIPVKGIKEYKFVYGNNQGQNAAAGGDAGIEKGKKYQKGNKKGKKPGKGNKPGNKPGEEFYEVEVTLEELTEYLFKDLNLPDLEQKKMKEIMSEQFRRKGFRNEGIRPRLSKKESAKRRIKRKKAAERAGTYDPESDENFTFIEDDLRYKHIKKDTKYATNACIFFVMDVSGSMSKEKKYLARSFFFLLYHFIRSKYEKTEIVFVAHDTMPYEVDEDKFFNRGSSGGTLVSPALEYVLEQTNKRYNPKSWNIYTFHCSDGDNWVSDMESAIEASKKLKEMCQFYGYCEIEPQIESVKWLNKEGALSRIYDFLVDDKFKIVNINKKDDVWTAFKKFFGGSI